MRFLILGGTIFLGRHIVTAARTRGHHVTIFHRGQHPAPPANGAIEILGDREQNLDRLSEGHWDVVVDTSGFVPHQVITSASALRDRVAHYLFISTISVYPDDTPPGADETAPVALLPEGASREERTNENYGPLKALCEAAIQEILPGRTTIIRPGLIVGPDDPTDRFTYWPRRIAAGGTVLAPGHPDQVVQLIDVRDLAEWTVRLAEQGTTGIFNATGPAGRTTLGDVLASCQAVIDSDVQLAWLPDQFLLNHGVAPWIEMPLWIPADQMLGLMHMDCRRALAAGLSYRPLAETVRATLAWDQTRLDDGPRRAGLDAEKERALLAAWHDEGHA